MQNKCLEPTRRSCYLCRNVSTKKPTGTVKTTKDKWDNTLIEEVMIYHAKFEEDFCPSQDKCLIKIYEYRNGVKFLGCKDLKDE